MTLQLYILRQLLISLGFAIAGIGLIVLPTIAIQAIHKLGAVSVVAVFRYLPLVMVELVPYLLPMAFLLAVVGTYGRLAAERELVAIRMAGIHPVRMCLPGFLIAIGLSLWTNHLLASVSPDWKYVQRNFLRQAQRDTFESLGAGKTEIEFGDCSLKAARRDGNRFHDVLLHLTNEDGDQVTVTAAMAELRIEDDNLYVVWNDARVLGQNLRLYVEAPFWSRPLDELFPFAVKDRSVPKYMRSAELREGLRSEELTPEARRDFTFEIQRRHALSVTYLLFLILGVPTGIMLRSSTQLGAFTGAVGYSFLYYVLALRLGKELALAGHVSPFVAAWTTDGIFLAAGLVLAYRALWR